MKTFKRFFKENTDIGKIGTESVALLPGGFKPPTKGHYNALMYMLQDADRGVVYIGKKERDGITAEQSKKIWDVYARTISKPIDVLIADITPVKSVYDFADSNKDAQILVGAGSKDDDLKRYAYFEKNIEKYPLVSVVKIPIQSEGISGTTTRELLATDIDKAIAYFVPLEVDERGRNLIKNILTA